MKHKILTKLQYDRLGNPTLLNGLNARDKNTFNTRVRNRLKNALIELNDIMKTEGFNEHIKDSVLTFEYLNPLFVTIFSYTPRLSQEEEEKLKADAEQQKWTYYKLDTEKEKLLKDKKEKYCRNYEMESEKERARLIELSRQLIYFLSERARFWNPKLYELIMETSNYRKPHIGIQTIILSEDWEPPHESERHKHKRIESERKEKVNSE